MMKQVQKRRFVRSKNKKSWSVFVAVGCGMGRHFLC